MRHNPIYWVPHDIDDLNEEVLTKSIYVDVSKYHFQITPYLKRFNRSNIKLILFDDYAKEPKKTLEDIFSFLDIDSFNYSSKLTHTNKTQVGTISHKKYDNPKTLAKKLSKALYILKKKFLNEDTSKAYILAQDTRKELLSLLKEDTLALEKLVNRDLSHWMR